ncbi:MAG TPA: hypothetical protein DG753_06000 [Clostridium sp.]|nr:hypothetical protein [Clostridium sp.]
MSHKLKKKKKECSFDFSNISKGDIDELNLIYFQVNTVGLLVYADLMYYFAVITAINDVMTENGSQRNGFKSDRLLIKYSTLGVWVYIYLTMINIIRYKTMQIRKAAGKFKFSLMPNLFIITGSILNIVIYLYFYQGANEFLSRDVGGLSFSNDNNKNRILALLNAQKNTMIIRFYADYLFFKASIESMIVVESKYNKEMKESEIPNPDITAINSQFLYLVSRTMIWQIAMKRLEIVINSIDAQTSYSGFLNGEILFIRGNLYGIIANIFAFIGFSEISNRNNIQPIFGG